MTNKKEELMEEARSLGLDPHHATGELKLQELINAELSKGDNKVENEPDPDKAQMDEPVTEVIKVETRSERMARLRKEQRKLVRVIVRCNNDNKKEWNGEIVTVICAAGTIKRYVPFDNENGWHIEQCILNNLENRTCQKFKNGRLGNGQRAKVSYMTKEFTIEKLKPLTKKELKELSSEQAARGSIDE